MNPSTKRRRWILKSSLALAMLGMLAVATLVASLWLEHRINITLPTPTGPFVVGRMIYDWTDSETVDTLAPSPGTKRELLVWIWYPAAPGQSGATDDYLPASMRMAVESSRGTLISHFLTRDLAKVYVHSLRNSSVSSQQAPYPVVILRAGASAEVWNYSALAEDLASHGYIVVGFDAPYRTNVVAFPDDRVMTRLPANNPELCLAMAGQERDRCVDRLLVAWTSDIAFVLDRLKQLNVSDSSGRFAGRLDMTRIGLMGHSFGGAAALEFCHQDPRCKAGIDLDGAPQGNVIEAGVDRPFMFLLSDHSHESEPDGPRIGANIQSIYHRLPVDARSYIAVQGANHFLFSDDGALLKSRIVLRALRMLGMIGIDGRRQLAITSYCVHSFFDAYLQGRGTSRLNLSSAQYPEIKALD